MYISTIKALVIIKAWKNVLFGVTSKEHKRRASICKTCEHAKYRSYLDFLKDDLEEVNGLVCGLCSCPLKAKIKSTDKCHKW